MTPKSKWKRFGEYSLLTAIAVLFGAGVWSLQPTQAEIERQRVLETQKQAQAIHMARLIFDALDTEYDSKK